MLIIVRSYSKSIHQQSHEAWLINTRCKNCAPFALIETTHKLFTKNSLYLHRTISAIWFTYIFFLYSELLFSFVTLQSIQFINYGQLLWITFKFNFLYKMTNMHHIHKKFEATVCRSWLCISICHALTSSSEPHFDDSCSSSVQTLKVTSNTVDQPSAA